MKPPPLQTLVTVFLNRLHIHISTPASITLVPLLDFYFTVSLRKLSLLNSTWLRDLSHQAEFDIIPVCCNI